MKIRSGFVSNSSSSSFVMVGREVDAELIELLVEKSGIEIPRIYNEDCGCDDDDCDCGCGDDCNIEEFETALDNVANKLKLDLVTLSSEEGVFAIGVYIGEELDEEIDTVIKLIQDAKVRIGDLFEARFISGESCW